MSPLQALFLGITQGLTEFLPISSSGHLTLFQNFMGLGDIPLAFDTFIHIATLLAVFIYFRRQIPQMLLHKPLHLIIGTLPAVVVGLGFYKVFPWVLNDIRLLGFGFILSALMVYVTAYDFQKGKSLSSLTYTQAFVIGVFQAFAILPSLSRSGSTIAAGRIVGLDQAGAFTFSFILSIPAIFGAFVLTAKDLLNNHFQILPLAIGFISSLITGLLSLKLLDLLLKRRGYIIFFWYTFILGILILGFTY